MTTIETIPAGALSANERSLWQRSEPDRPRLLKLARQRVLDYQHQAFDHEGAKPKMVCAAPGCAEVFQALRSSESFCSATCRERGHYHRSRQVSESVTSTDTTLSERSIECGYARCGKQFAPKRKTALYCSDKCRAAQGRRAA